MWGSDEEKAYILLQAHVVITYIFRYIYIYMYKCGVRFKG